MTLNNINDKCAVLHVREKITILLVSHTQESHLYKGELSKESNTSPCSLPLGPFQCNSQSFADSDHVHFVVHILTVQIVFSNLLSPMTSHNVNVSRTVLSGLPVIHQTYIHLILKGCMMCVCVSVDI